MNLQKEFAEEDSVFKHLTGLCEKFTDNLYTDNLCKQGVIKHLRSLAFNKLIFCKNVLLNTIEEEMESNIGFVVPDIYFTIHSLREKNLYNSTKEKEQNVRKMLEKVQQVVDLNPGVAAVLQLLLLLADTKPNSDTDEIPIFGLDLRKYRNLDFQQYSKPAFSVLPDSKFECENFSSNVFNSFVPQYKSSRRFTFSYPFEDSPGTGLRSYFRCTSFYLEKGLGSFHKDLDEEVFENTKWAFPPASLKQLPASRTSVHADEGYITPDNDHVWEKETTDSIPDYWDGSHLEPISSFRTWLDLGSKVCRHEKRFISQSEESVFHLWRIVREEAMIEESSIPSTQVFDVTIKSLSHDIKNLLISLESDTFYYNQESNSFAVKQGVYISGVIPETLEQYCQEYIRCANSCYLLKKLVNQDSKSETKFKDGLIFKSLSRCVERYILCYQGIILKLPLSQGLIRTNQWVVTLRTQLEFLANLCCVLPSDENITLPHGSALLEYIYNKVKEVVRQDLAYILYYILESCCHVYFRILEKWIFEGICDDPFEEFFIIARTDISFNRLFWTRGFVLNRLLVPGFLKGLENDLFVCGKSVSLLKLSNMNDSLLGCIKQGYPKVDCCLDQTGLDHLLSECSEYKEQCIAKCGSHPRVFNTMTKEEEEEYRLSLAKQREETVERIRKEREENRKMKSAHKQEVYEELKKGMEDEKVRKIEEKQSKLDEEVKMLEVALELEKAETLRRDEERRKMLEHYSSLSSIVEKNRLRSEWKLKRMVLNGERLKFLQNEEARLANISTSTIMPKDATTDVTILKKAQTTVSSDIESLKKYSVSDNKAAVTPKSTSNSVNINETDECNIPDSAKEVVSRSKHLKEDLVQAELNKRKVLQEEFGVFEYKNLPVSFSPENTGDFRFLSSTTVEKTHEKNEKMQKELRTLEAVMVDAGEARKKAIKNKEKACHREYNIITGEPTHFAVEHNIAELHKDNVSVDSEQVNQSFAHSVDSLETNNDNCETNKIIQEYSCDASNFARTENKQQIVIKECKSSYKDLNEIDKGPIIIDIADSIPFIDKQREINVKQIDITKIYSCLQKSVLFPLQTQSALVNDAILRLFINEHRLVAHLDCIQKYFFLLDGDYANNLTVHLFSEMQSVKHPSLLLNHLRLNSLLRTAVGNNTDEDLTERLSFRVNQVPTSFHLIDPNTLACLSMTYKTHWPLNIIITPEAVAKYDKVFLFLMQLRHASWALEQDFYLLKIKPTPTTMSSQYRQVLLYRHIMAHFLQAFQSYVMTTVMEYSWLELKKRLDTDATLEALYATHVSFLKRVIFRCLLNKRSKTIHKHLHDLFRIILSFHESLRSDNWTEDSNGDLQHPAFPRLCHQYRQFQELSRFLFSYLERLVTSGYQPHLEQLISLLSCNDFYKIK